MNWLKATGAALAALVFTGFVVAIVLLIPFFMLILIAVFAFLAVFYGISDEDLNH